MKVAVYSIAKNEEKHVQRWAESAVDADVLLIADTGSTDRTVEIAESLGIIVHRISVDPFRFDDARNASLALLPADIDYCIALDLDEVLEPGWRWELEKCYKSGVNRPHYRFITKVNPDGSVAQEFDGFRIHGRKNVRWKFPIHEVPMNYGVEEKRGKTRITIKHLPDESKSRGQYLPMLEMAVDEEPFNPRNLYYYARELFFHKEYLAAKRVFEEYLKYSRFPGEKSYALRYLAKCDPKNAEKHLKESIKTLYCRENVLALANHYYITKEWKKCLKTSLEAIEIKERLNDFMSEEWAYGAMAYDLVAISAWQLEQWDDALRYGQMALEIEPNNERFINNVKFYQNKVEEIDANIRAASG